MVAADTLLSREDWPSDDKAFTLTAHREADVGSTAAAAVASTLSQAWHRSAEKSGGDDDVSSDGSSTSIQPYLSPRQAFQIMVRLGTKKSVHTLSDPSVRHHVRRLTAVHVRHPEFSSATHTVLAHAPCAAATVHAQPSCLDRYNTTSAYTPHRGVHPPRPHHAAVAHHLDHQALSSSGPPGVRTAVSQGPPRVPQTPGPAG